MKAWLLALWWLVVCGLFIVLFIVSFDWPRTSESKPWLEYAGVNHDGDQ